MLERLTKKTVKGMDSGFVKMMIFDKIFPSVDAIDLHSAADDYKSPELRSPIEDYFSKEKMKV